MNDQGSSGPDDFSDLATPDGRPFWTSPEMYDPRKGRPLYTTAQTAKFFFGYGTAWLYRYLITEGVTSHPEIGELNLMRTSSTVPARRFRLYDVEVYAHILGAHGILQGIAVARTVRIIKLSAELWGYEL